MNSPICICINLPITPPCQELFRNQGGFHMIGSGRDKIEKASDLAAAATTVRQLELDGLVIIGGDDSNTNAAFLAEYFLANGRWPGDPSANGGLSGMDVVEQV